MQFTRRRVIVTLILVLIAIIAIVIFFGFKYRQVGWVPDISPDVKRALDQAGEHRSYSIEVQTEAVIGNKRIVIDGKYQVDSPRRRFASYSTTSVSTSGIPEVSSFSLANIVIENVVFTKLETESASIALTMPKTSGWKRFESDSIPTEFQQIAVPGPVLDNLLLLSDGGKYLSYITSTSDAPRSSEQRIRFKLSGEKPETIGTLSALIDRISADGTIDIWIDASTQQVTQMYFENSIYRSTTTIASYETPNDIVAPTSYN